MVATFVITLREGFEAALLLGIVYACLDRFGARAHYRWVTLGGALGLVASILMGIAVTFLSGPLLDLGPEDRKSTRLNSSHVAISYAVFCLKKKRHRQLSRGR